MRIEQQTIGLTVDDSLMRVHVARPIGDGPHPGLLFYSDIYQLGDPMLRLANRLLATALWSLHQRFFIASNRQARCSNRMRLAVSGETTTLGALPSPLTTLMLKLCRSGGH